MVNPKYLQYVAGTIIVLTIFVLGRCSKSDGEQSMRQFKIQQRDSLKIVHRAQEVLRDSLGVLNEIIEVSQAANREFSEQVSRLNSKLLRQVKPMVTDLVNSSDEALADTMISAYVKETAQNTGQSDNSLTNDSQESALNLTGSVSIPTDVSKFYILQYRQRVYLEVQSQLKDSIIYVTGLMQSEWRRQSEAWVNKEFNYKELLNYKEQEVELYRSGQNFMEGKARKYRRQRNAAIGALTVTVGVTVYGSYLLFFR